MSAMANLNHYATTFLCSLMKLSRISPTSYFKVSSVLFSLVFFPPFHLCSLYFFATHNVYIVRAVLGSQPNQQPDRLTVFFLALTETFSRTDTFVFACSVLFESASFLFSALCSVNQLFIFLI